MTQPPVPDAVPADSSARQPQTTDRTAIRAPAVAPMQGSRKYRDCLAAASDAGEARAQCTSAELAYQDRALNDLYRERTARLSGAALSTLRARQREWLRETDRQCGMAAQVAASERDAANACRLARTVAQVGVLDAGMAAPTPQTAQGLPDANGALTLHLGDAAIVLQSSGCERRPRFACRDARITIATTATGTQTLALPQVAFGEDAGATGYRGRLDDGFVDRLPTFMLTDIDADAHEDLIVWSGFDGAYGDPSYAYYLFDPKTGRFAENRALAEAVKGHTLSRVVGNRLDIWYRSGPCGRGEKTIEVRAGVPRVVKRKDYDLCDGPAP